MSKDTIEGSNLQQDAENNLIFSPNYTQIPNVIFDYWMSVLSHTEFKILLYICRETFGWHRIKKNISLKRLGEKTGLSKSTVCTGLKKLIESRLVIAIHSKTTHGDDDVNGYCVNVKEVVQNSDNVVQNLEGSPKFGQGVVQNSDTIKERNINKEKENTLTSIKESPAEILVPFGKYVKMTQVSYDELVLKYGKETIQEYIDRINDHISSKGLKPYKDYPATIRNWIRRSRADLKTPIPPHSEPPPINASVEKNLKFVQDCKKDYPSEFKDIRIFGKSHVTSDRKESKVSGHDYARFDMNPQEFENILFKMAGVRRTE